jgi:DNA polymerase I-like protein with 3'-5' exonuclease and polymerase domains
MIYLIGNAPDSTEYRKVSFVQFLQWENAQRGYQLDIETSVTPWWCDKKLITVQFGSLYNEDQWVIQWSSLTAEAKQKLRSILENHSKLKVAHNGMFECVILLFHGIRITNLFDTMLAEMVLYCGLEFKEDEVDDDDEDEGAGFYALTSLSNRYLLKRMDKTEQMNFGDDILTESKVLYAARDVQPLAAIMNMQKLELHHLDLEFVISLENSVLPAYAEMTYHGMELNTIKWRENIDLAMPVVQEAKQRLDEWLEKEPFWKKAMDMGFYDSLDRFQINWNSPQQKKLIVDKFFPFLADKMSKAVLTRLLKQHDSGKSPFSDDRVVPYVRAFAEGTWTLIETAIEQIDRQWLIDREFLIPGGQMTINWNSQPQVLPILQTVKPNLQNLNAESMSKFEHPIGLALTDYKDALKLITTYGEAFLSGTKKKRGSVEPDGRVRTTFNQIVSTGRISSRKPNMQNIPAKESVGTRYRNAFICSPLWSYVDSDFASQELVIIAYMSQDPVWNNALKLGQDLHSVCAELVFGKKWKDGGDVDCAFYALKDGKPAMQKCKCKAHKRMREAVKSINFGLAYGMSEYKLAATLHITVKEAKQLIDDYFKTFPRIGGMLGNLGRFGVTRGYIQTLSPFFRKRWFPYWKYVRNKIPEHIGKIQYDPTLGSIERQSKNTPIQGTAGDMAKLSLLMLYNEIHDNGLSDRVHLVMQVHDQNTSIARKDFQEDWKIRMDDIMKQAAAFIIPNGLLGAETTISPVWTK